MCLLCVILPINQDTYVFIASLFLNLYRDVYIMDCFCCKVLKILLKRNRSRMKYKIRSFLYKLLLHCIQIFAISNVYKGF